MPPKPGNAAGEVASVPEELTGQPRRVVLGGLRWQQTFAALRHRNFRLFFAGQLVSLTGTWMQNTAQGWLVYQLTGSKLWLGVVAAVGSAPMMLFSIWGGSVADRHPKRQIVLWTQSVMMVSALLFAALVATHQIRVWQILALAAVGGLAMCFFLNGLSFVAVIAGLLMMRLPKFVPHPHSGSALAHALEGFSYVWRHWRMRTILILFAIVGIFGWSYSVMMPAFAREVLNVDERGYGVLLSANGIGALLGALTVASIGHR